MSAKNEYQVQSTTAVCSAVSGPVSLIPGAPSSRSPQVVVAAKQPGEEPSAANFSEEVIEKKSNTELFYKWLPTVDKSSFDIAGLSVQEHGYLLQATYGAPFEHISLTTHVARCWPASDLSSLTKKQECGYKMDVVGVLAGTLICTQYTCSDGVWRVRERHTSLAHTHRTPERF